MDATRCADYKVVANPLYKPVQAEITQTPPSSFSTIPTINFRELTSHNAEERKNAIQVIAKAIRTIGFFALVDDELQSDTIEKGYSASKHFFLQDNTIKEDVISSKNGGQRGLVYGEIAQGAPKKDWKEFYHIGPESIPKESTDILVPNVWPHLEGKDFKEPMNKLFEHLQEKSLVIADALFDAVDDKMHPEVKEQMKKSLENSSNMLMRLLYYKKKPEDGAPWAYQHTDTGFFTILPRSEGEGLQVKIGEDWVPVVVPEGAYIVNLGDHFVNWTNGECKAALHRVVAPNNIEDVIRFAIVFFVHGTSNTSYKPLDSCIERTGGVQLYPALTQQQLLFARLYELGNRDDHIIKALIEKEIVQKLADYKLDTPKLRELLPKEDLVKGVKV